MNDNRFPLHPAAHACAILRACSQTVFPAAWEAVPLSIQADRYAEAEQAGNQQALAKGILPGRKP